MIREPDLRYEVDRYRHLNAYDATMPTDLPAPQVTAISPNLYCARLILPSLSVHNLLPESPSTAPAPTSIGNRWSNSGCACHGIGPPQQGGHGHFSLCWRDHHSIFQGLAEAGGVMHRTGPVECKAQISEIVHRHAGHNDLDPLLPQSCDGQAER